MASVDAPVPVRDVAPVSEDLLASPGVLDAMSRMLGGGGADAAPADAVVNPSKWTVHDLPVIDDGPEVPTTAEFSDDDDLDDPDLDDPDLDDPDLDDPDLDDPDLDDPDLADADLAAGPPETATERVDDDAVVPIDTEAVHATLRDAIAAVEDDAVREVCEMLMAEITRLTEQLAQLERRRFRVTGVLDVDGDDAPSTTPASSPPPQHSDAIPIVSFAKLM
jgi:hypothetical protein